MVQLHSATDILQCFNNFILCRIMSTFKEAVFKKIEKYALSKQFRDLL